MTNVRYLFVNLKLLMQEIYQKNLEDMQLIENDFLEEINNRLKDKLLFQFVPVVGFNCSLFSNADICGSSVKKFNADKIQNCSR